MHLLRSVAAVCNPNQRAALFLPYCSISAMDDGRFVWELKFGRNPDELINGIPIAEINGKYEVVDFKHAWPVWQKKEGQLHVAF